MTNWTKEELAQKLRDNDDLSIAGETKRNGQVSGQPQAQSLQTVDNLASKTVAKYHSQRTGHYASKKEAQYAADLQLRKQAGEVAFWLEQVSFPLPGVYTDKRGRNRRARHKLDYLVFLNTEIEGRMNIVPEFVEVKGRDLPMGKLKRMQVSELYGIYIKVV